MNVYAINLCHMEVYVHLYIRIRIPNQGSLGEGYMEETGEGYMEETGEGLIDMYLHGVNCVNDYIIIYVRT